MFFGDVRSSMAGDSQAYTRRAAFVNEFNAKVNKQLFTVNAGGVARRNTVSMKSGAISANVRPAPTAAFTHGRNRSASPIKMTASVPGQPVKAQGPSPAAAFFGEATNNVQESFKNMYSDLNKTFSTSRSQSQAKVNMDGTVALASAAAQAQDRVNLPKFNAGEYMQKAISDMKAKSDLAYAQLRNKG